MVRRAHHPERSRRKSHPLRNKNHFTLYPLPFTLILMPEDKKEEKLIESPLDTPELPTGLDPKNELPQGNSQDFDPVQTLLSWKGPSRPFRKKDRSYNITIAVIAVFLVLIFLIGQQFLLIGVIIALAFLAYVLAFIPPDDIEYRISTQGVIIRDHFYHWQQLDSFWFDKKEGFTVLHILTELRFPGILMLILAGVDEDTVRKICARFLPFHEIAPKSLIDKWADYIQKHFSLENPHK